MFCRQCQDKSSMSYYKRAKKIATKAETTPALESGRQITGGINKRSMNSVLHVHDQVNQSSN